MPQTVLKTVLIADNLIGSGAAGSVYRAHSPSDSQPYAVKVLRHPSPSALSQLTREALTLSKLRHPGIVSVFGFSKTGEEIKGIPEGPCFWMEYVEGRPLPEPEAAAASEAPAQIQAWLTQGLEALDYLHAQGILHGDLKPANILIDKHNKARLVDFGLALYRPDATESDLKTIRGTLPYLAPEILRGERVAATDLYALGTVFFKVLTGRHPRGEAKSLKDLFAADFTRLSDLSLNIPKRLARVIDRLIEPDLSVRFKSARDALEALKEGGSGLEVKPEDSPATQSFLLVGRENEWEKAQSFVESLQGDGVSGILLIHGLTGVGKSRLARDLSFHHLLQGRRVSRMEDLHPDQWKDIYHFLRDGSGSAYGGFKILILEYNDDLLDPASLHFFGGLQGERRVLNLLLDDLNREETRQLAESLLRRPLEDDALGLLFDRTHGNPGLLTEVARQIGAAGPTPRARLTAKAVRKAAFPAGFNNLLGKRLENLPAEKLAPTRGVLNALAVAPGAVAREDLGAVLDLQPLQRDSALQELTASGLLKTGTDFEMCRLSHEGLRPLLLQDMPPADREGWHRKWLGILEERADSDSDVAPALAHHALEVPAYRKRMEAVVRAGEIYSLRHEEQQAIDLYRRYLKINSSPEEREQILRHLANTHGAIGDFRQSLKVTEDWFREFPADPQQLNPVKYWLSTAIAYKNLGNFAESRRRLEACLNAGRADDPQHRPRLGRAHSLLGLLDLSSKDYAEARSHFEEAHLLLADRTEQKAEVFKHQALLASEENRWEEALTFLRQAEDVLKELDSMEGLFSIALERGNLAFKSRSLSEIEAAYGEALRVAAKYGDEHLLARIHHNLGVLACRRGDFMRAFDELEKARELFLFFGNAEEKGLNLLQIALARASVGDFAAADRHLGQAVILAHTSSFQERFQEVGFEIETLKKGAPPSNRPPPLTLEITPQAWDLEYRWLFLMLHKPESHAEEFQLILLQMHESLSDPLKLGFEERPDYRRYVLKKLKTPLETGETSMNILHKLNAITRDLLTSNRVDEVLKRIMDSAIELSHAERGFLLVQSNDPESPLPGFAVKAARNFAKEFLSSDDFRMSLSAVREVIKTGNHLVTDNAVLDQRFKTAESVQELELKSILVLPLKTTEGVVGVLYLDHTYETAAFHGTDLEVLQMFADQAALALQKARMIENLSETVSSQTSELTFLKKAVEGQRLKLTHEYAEIVGQSPAMVEVLSLVDRLIDTSIPVWIYGESGTGKEMIARALHYKGPRAKLPFVSENCSSLPENLLESELFGHKKGSFTHADRDKKGLLQHANGGTVFLDEIADMSPAMQSKLLRFLQEGEIRPVGSNDVIKVDVRVVSASNKDLQKLIHDGKFREDLFYRLNGMTVALPSLRERIEDIPILVQHFLKRLAQAEKGEKKAPLEIAPEALDLLTEYDWPGNVRELENTIRSACLFQYKGKLLPKSFHFKKALFGKEAIVSGGAVIREAVKKKGHEMDEKALLLKALQENHFHKGETAQALGISRRYLYTKLSQHDIPLKRIAMKAYVEKALS